MHRYHSPAAVKKLELMSKNAPDAPAERGVSTSVIGVAFEALRQRLVAEGCFEPNYPDEAFKLVLTIGPGFLGARLLHSGMPALGTLLMYRLGTIRSTGLQRHIHLAAHGRDQVSHTCRYI